MLSPKLKNISILIACALLVAGMSSCRKNETPGPGYINIRGGVSTRTFFGSTNFNDTSNRAKILDFITLPGQNENSTPYIDDELYSNKIGHEVEGIASDWNWSLSGNTYFWTNTGSHRFISWLTFDADMNLTTNSFFGSAPTLDTPTRKVLSIPAKTFNSSTPQFDFIYSNAAIRSMDDANKNYSSVLLAYKHLFTAFSIGIRNWTPTPVVIKSFQLKNMPDTKSGVTVTFKPEAEGGSVSNAMSVTGTSGNTGDLFFSKSDYNTTLNYGQAIVDLFNSSHTYVTNYMMWPLSSAEIYDANSTTDENGRIVASADAPQMIITYNMSDTDITRYIPFPDMAWEAGKKYHFELQFVQKEIRLRFETLPWDYVAFDLTYGEDAIQGEELSFDDQTCYLESDSLRVTYNGTNIRASFVITSPINSTWMISMKGDVDYFRLRFDETSTYYQSVFDADYTNPNVTILSGPTRADLESGRVWFEIVPLTLLDRSIDHKIELDFMVRSSAGRMVDGNSEFNPDSYDIILPKE
jgi:hypothetical protein